MTRGLYGWKPPSGTKDHLDQQAISDAAYRAAIAADQPMKKSPDWLAHYATNRQSRFNWSGILPVTIPPKEIDHEEIEAAFVQTGQAAQERVAEGVGDAAGEEADAGVDEPIAVRGQCEADGQNAGGILTKPGADPG